MSSDLPRANAAPRTGSFLEAARRGVLTLDGGMGTQLYERGVLFNVCYEELSVTRPELVQRIHDDYVRAGAQVIETNTFGGNAIRLARHGFEGRVAELNGAAVAVARRAAEGRAFVAGAIGPTGLVFGGFSDDESARVRAAFRAQSEALAQAGVDLLMVETMRQPEELELAIEGVRAGAGRDLPLVAQVSVDESLSMADGTSVATIGARLVELGCDVIGVNCSDGPQGVLAAVEKLLPLGALISAVPNAGLPRRVDDRFIYVSTPEYFGVFARRLFKLGVRLIGGCCGTTPEHVRRIAAAARMEGSAAASSASAESELGPNLWTSSGDSGGEFDLGTSGESERPAAMTATGTPLPTGVVVVPRASKSRFAGMIGRKFVVSVEVNPPMGLDPKSAIDAARVLIDGGVDVINIADGARAQARMSNVALARCMQDALGIETLLHVCGRDRNLLGQVAHLIGAHALGMKNLVVITGDPPKMGDFPDATAVYDLDSIGILRLVSRMNKGIDPGGKALGGATSFFCATGAEPAALNYEREIQRLWLKKRAGAEVVMTQPVYDPAVLERFLKDVAPMDLPVLVGILPLASHKNAEFLHNEVPGMQIPDDVRARMRAAGSGAEARRAGVAIARELLL
ncbi:MAG TPA: bifunctional homocysteine S-methyltransferase/methylenetetrahydrofolate reductase, partial [Byssovorax sp.]